MLLFVLSNFLVFAIAAMLADVAMHDREPRRRVLALLVTIPVVATGIVLVLGTAARLSAVAATISAAVLAAAVAPLWWTARRRRAASRTPAPAFAASGAGPEPGAGPNAIAPELVVGFFAAFAGLYVVKTVIGPTGFWSDCLVYHAMVVADWMREGSIGYLAQYQAYWPLNSEAFTCWIVLPFGRDGAGGYSGAYWIVVAIAAVYALVRNLGQRWPVALFTCGLFLASNCVLRDVLRFAATDVAFAGLILAAVALVTPSSATPSRQGRIVDGIYAGLAIGFAAGAKVLALPAAGVLLLWFALGQKRVLDLRSRAIVVATFSLVAALTGGYWYARNWLVTGNPLFPAQFGPFDGPFTAADQYRTKLVYWLFSDPSGLLEQWNRLGRIANWGFGLALVALLGFGALLRSLFRGAAGERLRDPAWLLPAAIAALVVATYPILPFSGRLDNPDGPLTVTSRYITVSFAVGLVFYAALADPRGKHATFWCALAFVGALSGWLSPYTEFAIDPGSFLTFVPILAGVGALFAYSFARETCALILRRASSPAVAATIVLAGLGGLALWEPAKQKLTDEQLFAYSMDSNTRIGEAWRPIESLPPGARITAFGPRTWMYYPLLGRRLQHHVVPVYEDGHRRRVLHERWVDERFAWWEDDPPAPDPRTLLENLRASGVDHVMITKGHDATWPSQQAALAAGGGALLGARLLHEDAITAIWKLEAMPRVSTRK